MASFSGLMFERHRKAQRITYRKELKLKITYRFSVDFCTQNARVVTIGRGYLISEEQSLSKKLKNGLFMRKVKDQQIITSSKIYNQDTGINRSFFDSEFGGSFVINRSWVRVPSLAPRSISNEVLFSLSIKVARAMSPSLAPQKTAWISHF